MPHTAVMHLQLQHFMVVTPFSFLDFVEPISLGGEVNLLALPLFPDKNQVQLVQQEIIGRVLSWHAEVLGSILKDSN